jgi:hypothetical protein
LAHSILDYKGKHVVLSDSTLLVVLHFLVAELERESSAASKDLAQELSRTFVGCTPGCLIVPLDDLSRNAEQWVNFCPALVAAIERLKAYGTSIPKIDLERMWRADDGGQWLGDSPTSFHLEAATKLGRLCNCLDDQ